MKSTIKLLVAGISFMIMLGFMIGCGDKAPAMPDNIAVKLLMKKYGEASAEQDFKTLRKIYTPDIKSRTIHPQGVSNMTGPDQIIDAAKGFKVENMKNKSIKFNEIEGNNTSVILVNNFTMPMMGDVESEMVIGMVKIKGKWYINNIENTIY
ncbi:MAG: hypothetical protein HN737_14410 [Desulfobacterales bacterium]|jgi:hypothetical protein|nr:hypothetical protein [Desulfobacteraceae bacterium]MBT7086184.1 hypothetical protein [Desulfobacterales bacterium]MBT7698590.1 hypothetical protein [Desulfobacterales bacterium]